MHGPGGVAGTIAICCSIVVATGCGRGESRSGGTAVRDSAAIVIVENDHTRPAWGERGLRMSGEPILSIGALDSEGPDQLYRVGGSRRLDDGRIAVLNTGTAEVRFFDGDGRHLSTIGGHGEGPGEFMSPWAVYPHAGDSLLVLDLYRAVSVFDSTGSYARRFVPGEIGGESQGTPVGQFAAGTLLMMQYQRQQPGRTGLGRSMVKLVEVDLDGSVVNTFGDFEDQEVMYGSGSQYLFGAWAHEAAADSTMWYAPGDRFEIREVARDGRTLRLVRLDVPRVPVTQADVDGALDDIRERFRADGQEQMMNRMYADVQHPANFPATFDLMVDDVGNLWVQDYKPYHAPADRTWYAFDPDGSYLGSMVVPARFSVYQIGEDFILGRWTDDLDVEYVRMYRLERPD